MDPMGWTLRLDPWSAEYDASVLLTDAEEPAATVDPRVETADWGPVRPAAPPFAPPIYFVDGVRRIDHRLRIVGPGTCFGLLGTFAVGACAAGVQPGVVRDVVARLMCVGGGVEQSSQLGRNPTSPGHVSPRAPVAASVRGAGVPALSRLSRLARPQKVERLDQIGRRWLPRIPQQQCRPGIP